MQWVQCYRTSLAQLVNSFVGNFQRRKIYGDGIRKRTTCSWPAGNRANIRACTLARSESGDTYTKWVAGWGLDSSSSDKKYNVRLHLLLALALRRSLRRNESKISRERKRPVSQRGGRVWEISEKVRLQRCWARIALLAKHRITPALDTRTGELLTLFEQESEQLTLEFMTALIITAK